MVGLLIIWLIVKAMKPAVHSFCTYILESDDSNITRQGRIVSVEGEVVKAGTMTKKFLQLGRLEPIHL